MFSKRKSLPAVRSRSVTPVPEDPGHPNKKTKHLSTIVNAITAAAAPKSPTREESPALVFAANLGAGGSIRHRDERPRPLLDNNWERIEAMDLSDEDAEDVLANTPWHVRRWIRDTADLEYPESDPLSFTTSIMAHIENAGNAPNIPDVTLIKADVCPSVSGVTTTSRPVARPGARAGSDLDSEFDDEFDGGGAPVQTSVLPGLDRDIPDNDELEEPVREALNAIQSAMDEEVERMLGVSVDYQWEEGFETFRGRRETFSGPTPGPIKDYDTPYDAFTDIWSRDIIELIARETNRYARQTIETMRANGSLKSSSRLHKWVDTNADEMMVLFAVFIYMGIDSRTSQNEYWMKNNILEMPKFRQLITYDRYILLSKFLHFIDNSDASQNLTSSGGVVLSPKLAKLAPVISHLIKKFASLYNLEEEICIDESLTLCKSRLSWAQTIRTKSARFGIKSYELCESRTGYMYKFEIYTGKNSADVPLSVDLGGKSTRIVLDLLKGLERRGHCVTMDNFYNSPALARYLKSQGFDCLGTLRTNRKNVPRDIANIPKNVAKGTIIARHCGDVSIIAWKDVRVVPIISTFHDAKTYAGSRGGNTLVKPVCIKDYNDTMGGVDLKDQKLSMYLVERKRGVKWYIKMFKRLLNVSIHNAFVLYVGSLKRRHKPLITHRAFRYALAKGLVDEHCLSKLEVPEQVDGIMRLRKDVVHVPRSVPGNANRKRCTVCWRQDRKEKKVHSLCVTCDEYMCFENCWKEWHSSTKLKEIDPRGRKRNPQPF